MLNVSIPSFKFTNKSTYFQIKVEKTNGDLTNPESIQHEKNRNFNDFHKLYNDLVAENYTNIPDIPRKTITKVSGQNELEKRRKDL